MSGEGWGITGDGLLSRHGSKPTPEDLAWALARLNGERTHGESGYRGGCRCETCTKVVGAISARKRRRKQQELPGGRSAGNEWTGPEVELLEREDLTTKQIAEMLGRSFYAVEHAKRRLETRYAYLAGKR